jgi:hypothetical protein
LNILQLTDEYDLKFLLAFLNSKLMAFYHIRKTVKGNRSLFPKLVVKDLIYYPIPNISDQGQKPFSEIVDKIIEEKKHNSQADTRNLENRIDILVYKLYNLEYQETKIVDPQVENIISKKEYEKLVIE